MNKLKQIKKEAENEAYLYFHENIRHLPKTEEGNWDFKTGEFINNDVDAFRHTYVSGVFTQKFNEAAANILGQLKELEGDLKRNQPPEQKNMDLWNNQVGRKYGSLSTTRNELANLIDSNKPIIVVEENETGRNEWFLDLAKGTLLSRDQFVQAIGSGTYPGYLVADINNISTPMSKPDGVSANNLG